MLKCYIVWSYEKGDFLRAGLLRFEYITIFIMIFEIQKLGKKKKVKIKEIIKECK